jgi:hypothetical protein
VIAENSLVCIAAIQAFKYEAGYPPHSYVFHHVFISKTHLQPEILLSLEILSAFVFFPFVMFHKIFGW